MAETTKEEPKVTKNYNYTGSSVIIVNGIVLTKGDLEANKKREKYTDDWREQD